MYKREGVERRDEIRTDRRHTERKEERGGGGRERERER